MNSNQVEREAEVYKSVLLKSMQYAKENDHASLKLLIENFENSEGMLQYCDSADYEPRPSMRIMEHLNNSNCFDNKEIFSAFASDLFRNSAYADSFKFLALVNLERGNMESFKNIVDFIKDSNLAPYILDWQLSSLSYLASKEITSSEALKAMSNVVPITPATGKILYERGIEAEAIIEALHLSSHMYAVQDSKTNGFLKGFHENNPGAKHPLVYDASSHLSLATSMLRNGDKKNAAKLIDGLINSPFLEQSNFSLHAVYSIVMLHTWSDPEFMSIFARNENRLLSVMDTLISMEPYPDSLLSNLTIAQLKQFGTGSAGEITEVSRDLAVHMGECGAKTLGKLIYLLTKDRISSVDQLIKDAEILGEFSPEDLSTIYAATSSHRNPINFFSEKYPTNLGAFLHYAEQKNVDLQWRSGNEGEGLFLYAAAQLVQYSGARRESLEANGNDKCWIENLNSALYSISNSEIRKSVLESKQILDNIPEIRNTSFFKRHTISNDLDL